MFLHAALLARHNTMVLAAALDPLAMLAAGVICQGDGTGDGSPVVHLPGSQNGSTVIGECPICQGALSAAAILPEPLHFIRIREAASERILTIAERIAERFSAGPPPSRAPPALV
jgi:hypothetical protein